MSSEKKEIGEYYLGLDIGTDSVGWCVTDPNYKVLKAKGKATWGVRLFDAANSAADRRGFRTARRRLHRRNQRVKLVQELLGSEVSKVDPLFFMRLEESKFHFGDKKPEVRQRYTLFADQLYTDKDYHREFPTIYHLRRALMEHKKKYDIRLYYLAISHFMKHRGHFLFEGELSEKPEFEEVFQELREYVSEQMEFSLDAEDLTAVKSVLCDRKKGLNDKKKEMNRLFNASSDLQKEALAALCGSTVQLAKLFGDDDLKGGEIEKFSFRDGVGEEDFDKLSSLLGDRFEYFQRLKAVYDWMILDSIMGKHASISEAQVARYEKHRDDLKDLKAVFRLCLSKEQYDAFFSGKGRDPKATDVVGYDAYSGRRSFGDVDTWKKRPEQIEFCEGIKKILKNVAPLEDARLSATLERIKSEAEEGVFMPKQVSKGNSVIPYQIHQKDLNAILDALCKDYHVFAEKGADGLSVREKLSEIFKFRIPYFVGPLNTYHSDKGGNSWMKRKEGEEKGEIRPWNFNSKVDRAETAERFMRRLTSKCTYLHGEDVLPKNSLLYSKFMVLNELNNVRIEGERLSPALKQKIFKENFETRSGKFTLAKLCGWLKKEGFEFDENQVGGVDGTFQGTLKSYQDFVRILGGEKQGKARVDADPSMVETIVQNILVFGEDKKMLRERILAKYGDKLNTDEIKRIAKLSYSGWGRLSEKFLNGIKDYDPRTGRELTIVEAMWEGQENMMELLSDRHGYMKKINALNAEFDGTSTSLTYDLVRESYASPAVKRGVWQTLLIVDELRKVFGADPARVFIEVAREKEKNPQRKASKKQRLLDLYKNIKDEERDWSAEINEKDERQFNSKKLYLYYAQMGRDIYTGERISLSELFSKDAGGDVYDVDHIIPQSKTKDDSLLNNLVLTRSSCNKSKGDRYPVPDNFKTQECKKLWKLLFDKGFITKEKYERLTRNREMTEDELAGFISRQLVETRQSTKLVADILKKVVPQSKIVYSKATVVSDFRRDAEFWKSRSINDYHHAKDAYLNIVVGNVYYTKFTDDPRRFFRENHGGDYNLKRLFDFDVERGGKVAWTQDKNGSIATVREQMAKNNILFTRYATEKRGGFWDQMPLDKSGTLKPLKSTDPRLDPKKYGGYDNAGANYLMLVESDDKNGRMRTLEWLPVYLSGVSREKQLEYLQDEAGLALKNPKILIPEIKINSLLKIDGVPMHISSKSGNRIAMKYAVQLVLAQEDEKTAHRIEKFLERRKENKNTKIDEDHDGICEENIVRLFDSLGRKACEKIYSKRLDAQKDKILQGKETFLNLSIEDQCLVLSEMLILFNCSFKTADLKLIGGSGQSGAFMISKKISSDGAKKSSQYMSVLLIHQSVTGLFEYEVDLLTVGK